MKITKKALIYKFEEVCKEFNLKTRKDVTLESENPKQTTFFSDDYYSLQYDDIYNGYRFTLILKDTGECDAFGSGYNQKTASEMFYFFQGMLLGKKLSK